jgi:hypothetical protein
VSATVTIAVKLANTAGTPVYNASATFRIGSQPSSAKIAALSETETATGYDGTAATQFTLGDITGAYSVVCEVRDAAGANVAGSPLTFNFATKADSEHLFIPSASETTEMPGGPNDKDSKDRFTKLLVDGQGRKLISYTDPTLGDLKADGKTKAEIAILVFDIYGNKAPGVSVRLTRRLRDTAGREAGREAFADTSQTAQTDVNGVALFEDSASDPGEYEYQADIGGLSYGPAFRVAFAAVALALGDVHVYPNPWRPGNPLCFAGDLSTNVTFTISVYDIRGSRARDIAGAAPIGLTPDGQRKLWCGEGVNNGGRPLASGVYMYYLEAWDAMGAAVTAKGQFSVVR